MVLGKIGSSYTIKGNDTLYKIAEKQLGDGDRWIEILKPNGARFTEEEANNLQSGQEICIPNGKTNPPPPTSSGGLIPDQKRRAEQFTSIFENDTIELQYDYVEDIGDGRGFTCGRAGFTTATGDAVEVVQLYTNNKSDNPLAKYLPELKRLAKEESDDTSNLDGFENAWKKAAKDSAFRAAQDEVVDKLYYQPSAKRANDAGLKLALSRAALYDTIIQHGEGDDPDGLPALLKRTQKEAGGTPKTGVDEKQWLQAFLKVRRADLAHAYNEDTREEWAQSVDRCDALSAIAKSGNYDLNGPIHVKTPNHDATIP
ncbi:MAG: chitosanase [Heteroscytonema crispum UTEX LB 1556]